MSWAEVKEAFRALRDEPAQGAIAARWEAFLALALKDPPPYHLRLALREIRGYQVARAADAITVLDHGCGDGLSVLYLHALGYRACGVDLRESAHFARINAEFGSEVLQGYDGRRLPFPDASVDVVLSQQVLEHVADNLVEAYYAEEGRVLKPGGIALHQVPHRLVPFDSHTQTWFTHWLPAPLRNALYRRLGFKSLPQRLHYRTPWFHRAAARRHIGLCDDLTIERLRLVRDFDAGTGPVYDGNVGLRRLVDRAIHAPAVGQLLGRMVRPFVMLDSVSHKRPAQPRQDLAGGGFGPG